MRRGWFLFFTGLGIFFSLFSCVPFKKHYDIVIKNGLIVDGTDNPWFRADIGIKDKKISKIGWIDKNQNNYLWEAKIRDKQLQARLLE